MKSNVSFKLFPAFCWLAFLPLVTAHGQGTFVNLDFELAQVPDTPPGGTGGVVSGSDALPGWSALPGQFGEVYHNTTTIGSPSITLFGPNWNSSDIFQGRYTVRLATAFSNTGSAIGQTGQIPSDARSMRFYAQVFNMNVSFAGSLMPFYEIGSGPNYGIYGVDVSGLAGVTGELRFTAVPLAGGGFGGVRLDNIFFSPEPIPEPSVFGSFTLGVLIFSSRLRRKRES
jgi:hypothetical protein